MYTNLEIETHRIHGTGIFTYLNGWFFHSKCGYIYHTWIYPMGNEDLSLFIFRNIVQAPGTSDQLYCSATDTMSFKRWGKQWQMVSTVCGRNAVKVLFHMYHQTSPQPSDDWRTSIRHQLTNIYMQSIRTLSKSLKPTIALSSHWLQQLIQLTLNVWQGRKLPFIVVSNEELWKTFSSFHFHLFEQAEHRQLTCILWNAKSSYWRIQKQDRKHKLHKTARQTQPTSKEQIRRRLSIKGQGHANYSHYRLKHPMGRWIFRFQKRWAQKRSL